MSPNKLPSLLPRSDYLPGYPIHTPEPPASLLPGPLGPDDLTTILASSTSSSLSFLPGEDHYHNSKPPASLLPGYPIHTPEPLASLLPGDPHTPKPLASLLPVLLPPAAPTSGSLASGSNVSFANDELPPLDLFDLKSQAPTSSPSSTCSKRRSKTKKKYSSKASKTTASVNPIFKKMCEDLEEGNFISLLAPLIFEHNERNPRSAINLLYYVSLANEAKYLRMANKAKNTKWEGKIVFYQRIYKELNDDFIKAVGQDFATLIEAQDQSKFSFSE